MPTIVALLEDDAGGRPKTACIVQQSAGAQIACKEKRIHGAKILSDSKVRRRQRTTMLAESGRASLSRCSGRALRCQMPRSWLTTGRYHSDIRLGAEETMTKAEEAGRTVALEWDKLRHQSRRVPICVNNKVVIS